MLCKDGTVQHIEKNALQKRRLPFYKSKKQHKEDIKKYPPACGKKEIGGGKRGRRKNGG